MSIRVLVVLCVMLLVKSATDADVVESIRKHNEDRRQLGRTYSAFIFLFITLGYTSMTTLLAILLAWMWQPFASRLKMRVREDNMTKVHTAIWWGILIGIVVILTAGGLPGWMVLGFLYCTACICIGVVTCLVSHRSKYGRPCAWATVEVAPVNTSNPNETPVIDKRPLNWTTHPEVLGKVQLICSLTMGVMMVLFIVLILILFYAWNIPEYQLWDKKQEKLRVEFIPDTVAKGLQLLYGWEGLASNLQANIYAKMGTTYCGKKFTRKLEDNEKEKAIYKGWLEVYDDEIDMNLFEPSDYKEYDSVNSWFIREFKTGVRQYDQTYGTDQIVSPADCRMLIYPNLDESSTWLKGGDFNYKDLLDDDQLAKTFEGGYMVIARLAPQDYHRFNTPIAPATIESVRDLSGTYWSVNPDAATSANNAFYNLRKVVILDTHVGKVAYVAIGATCVGSVVIGRKEGYVISSLGEELGFMQYGGSTIVMLFEKGKVKFDPDITSNSLLPVETYVQVNSNIGFPL